MAGEFDFIAKHLRPLAAPAPSAFGLTDDVALIPQGEGAMVVSADMLVEGTHFLPQTDPRRLAWKALAVNVSDILAKGARPFGYILTLALPRSVTEADLAQFAAGLSQGQEAYGLALLGGDTTSTPGPLTLSVTIFGRCGSRGPVLRSGAQVDDDVWVTGPIGSGVLGLKAARGEAQVCALDDRHAGPAARDAYEAPAPPAGVWALVEAYANASIDISDGLLADLSHIADRSSVGIRIDLDEVPRTDLANAWIAAQDDPRAGLMDLVTGGDDYQIAFTASPELRGEIASRADLDDHHRVTRIGCVTAQSRLRLFHHGTEIPPPETLGFTHF